MEYKFRYWSTRDSVMMDWACLMQTAFNLRSVAEQHDATEIFDPLIYRVLGVVGRSNGVLMLWTGLVDAKGTPIYEGDIVRCGQNVELEVRWGQGRAGFFLHREYGSVVWNLSGGGKDGVCETCTVVGNRYEHPDLFRRLSEP